MSDGLIFQRLDGFSLKSPILLKLVVGLLQILTPRAEPFHLQSSLGLHGEEQWFWLSHHVYKNINGGFCRKLNSLTLIDLMLKTNLGVKVHSSHLYIHKEHGGWVHLPEQWEMLPNPFWRQEAWGSHLKGMYTNLCNTGKQKKLEPCAQCERFQKNHRNLVGKLTQLGDHSGWPQIFPER